MVDFFQFLSGEQTQFHALCQGDFLVGSQQRHPTGLFKIQANDIIGIERLLIPRVCRQILVSEVQVEVFVGLVFQVHLEVGFFDNVFVLSNDFFRRMGAGYDLDSRFDEAVHDFVEQNHITLDLWQRGQNVIVCNDTLFLALFDQLGP